MPFPVSPNPGDSYTDAYGTVWIYAGSVNGWYRQTVIPGNETSYTADLITTDKIIDNTIINADVASNAAIAGTKISPNFGSQNVTTTGTSTAARFIPTSSTAPTNGLYLSAANSVALSTNGNGRLFVDSNGNVGVGITPTTRFHVYQTGSTQAGLVETNQSASVINFKSTGQSSGQPQVGCAASDMILNTNGTERLRITSTGQLSHIGAGSSGSPAVSFSGSANSNSLVVDSSSRVGIGTSTPSERLDLGGGVSDTINIRFTMGGNVAAIGSTGSGVANGLGNLTFATRNGSTLATAMTIDGSQRVGIGATSPAALLDVQGSAYIGKTDSTYGTRIIAGSGSYAQQEFYNGATRQLFIHSRGDISYSRIVSDNWLLDLATAAAQPILFTTNGNERARIDSSGRLLVGTASSPNSGNGQYAKFVVQSNTVGAAGYISLQRNQSATLPLTNTSELGHINFGDNAGNSFASIQAFADADTANNDYPGRLVFSTTADGAASPTERMRITSAGVLQIADAGDIAVGTTTGTKIGTATTQKLGFFNKTPVVQPAAVADATDAASVITQLNALLARMRDLGLIAI